MCYAFRVDRRHVARMMKAVDYSVMILPVLGEISTGTTPRVPRLGEGCRSIWPAMDAEALIW